MTQPSTRSGMDMAAEPASSVGLRDVVLAGVLPTAAALSVATVILIERLQGDASARPSVEPLRVWFACAFAFGFAHILGSWLVQRGGLFQRFAFLTLFAAASFWPALGGVFIELMRLQGALLIALYVLILPPMLLPLVPAVPSYLFGVLLALAVAPAAGALTLRHLWRLTVFYGLACTVAGMLAALAMVFSSTGG